MALHGNIRVNYGVIGWYEIRRLEQLGDPGATYEYAYEVHFPAQWAQPVVGTLRHQYSHGPAVLIALVMAAANHRAARLPQDE